MGSPVQGDSIGEKRQATLRCGAASLTETARRASFKHHGGPAGEEAP
ncbi:DUF6380 family protein [Streptomyces yaanensis]|uniref:DUF6380 family protein n=1 Tax=Streptomyces yaanensis TaxID=1142239 RepID=A0ABV7SFL0_9ACTN|nr:DUF6380 family protein [Streptomyces sp. CGMCC 4.7035]WNB99231.1 DUF6380 family protein [Streptomyces sp. CGMCC 4.7035]